MLGTGVVPVPYLFCLCQGLLRYLTERKAPEKIFKSVLVPMRYGIVKIILVLTFGYRSIRTVTYRFSNLLIVFNTVRYPP
jgi:hypothetical protein